MRARNLARFEIAAGSKSCEVSQPYNTNCENPSAIPIGPSRRQVIWPENQLIRKRTNPCALPYRVTIRLRGLGGEVGSQR